MYMNEVKWRYAKPFSGLQSMGDLKCETWEASGILSCSFANHAYTLIWTRRSFHDKGWWISNVSCLQVALQPSKASLAEGHHFNIISTWSTCFNVNICRLIGNPRFEEACLLVPGATFLASAALLHLHCSGPCVKTCSVPRCAKSIYTIVSIVQHIQ